MLIRWWRRRVSRLPPGRRRLLDGLAVLLIVAGALYALRAFGTSDDYAQVRVIDGDSLRAGDTEIRLQGIDAPEYRQRCRDGAGREYACGRRATRHLRHLIGSSPVQCRSIETDRYHRAVAICSAAGRELNRAMVEAGWAVAYLRHSLAYGPAQARAQKARRGLWAGTFEVPEDWRAANRASLAGSTGASLAD